MAQPTAAKRKPAAQKAAKVTTTNKRAPKKAPAKKTPAKKPTKHQGMQSFKVYKDNASFTDFRLTRQTLYWIILVAFIVFAQLWIIKLQVEVATLIESQQQALTN